MQNTHNSKNTDTLDPCILMEDVLIISSGRTKTINYCLYGNETALFIQFQVQCQSK
jgi:hypothetical protein